MTRDKAGRSHWEATWNATPPGTPADPEDGGLDNTLVRRFHAYFQRWLAGDARGKKLLEVGCARSRWLPYFSRQFGLAVTGLDYSETGCRQAREILSRAQVPGRVFQADFLAPPESLLSEFDLVVSFGVAEHFDDTAECIGAFARFLRPGGMMITSVPNMAGSLGWLQRLLNRPVFDLHVPLRREALAAAHRAAGLEPLDCRYFLFASFGACSLAGVAPSSPGYRLRYEVYRALSRLSKVLWLVEGRCGELPANRVTSPFINCVARKPRQ